VAQLTRFVPERTLERALFGEYGLVAGLDEVGRGAWAGPVVAAAVILPEECALTDIYDSKLMLPTERAAAVARIIDGALDYAVGLSSVHEINTHGLSWGIKMAGWRALRGLTARPGCVLLDGHWDYLPKSFRCRTQIGADRLELSVAAASVIAKVHRDRLMATMEKSDRYGFAQHKGYGTLRHRQALARHGVSRWHRRTYAPVAEVLQASISMPV